GSCTFKLVPVAPLSRVDTQPKEVRTQKKPASQRTFMSILLEGSPASRGALGRKQALGRWSRGTESSVQNAFIRLQTAASGRLIGVLLVDREGALVKLIGLAEELIILGLKGNVFQFVAHGDATEINSLFASLAGGRRFYR